MKIALLGRDASLLDLGDEDLCGSVLKLATVHQACKMPGAGNDRHTSRTSASTLAIVA
jgi:hypothetical protein